MPPWPEAQLSWHENSLNLLKKHKVLNAAHKVKPANRKGIGQRSGQHNLNSAYHFDSKIRTHVQAFVQVCELLRVGDR